MPRPRTRSKRKSAASTPQQPEVTKDEESESLSATQPLGMKSPGHDSNPSSDAAVAAVGKTIVETSALPSDFESDAEKENVATVYSNAEPGLVPPPLPLPSIQIPDSTSDGEILTSSPDVSFMTTPDHDKENRNLTFSQHFSNDRTMLAAPRQDTPMLAPLSLQQQHQQQHQQQQQQQHQQQHQQQQQHPSRPQLSARTLKAAMTVPVRCNTPCSSRVGDTEMTGTAVPVKLHFSGHFQDGLEAVGQACAEYCALNNTHVSKRARIEERFNDFRASVRRLVDVRAQSLGLGGMVEKSEKIDCCVIGFGA
eukprot:UC1_evm1s313